MLRAVDSEAPPSHSPLVPVAYGIAERKLVAKTSTHGVRSPSQPISAETRQFCRAAPRSFATSLGS